MKVSSISKSNCRIQHFFLIWGFEQSLKWFIATGRYCLPLFHMIKEGDTNFVHKLRWQVFGFFWPPTALQWQFLPYKSSHFWTTYPTFLVKVVCERPLGTNLLKVAHSQNVFNFGCFLKKMCQITILNFLP